MRAHLHWPNIFLACLQFQHKIEVLGCDAEMVRQNLWLGLIFGSCFSAHVLRAGFSKSTFARPAIASTWHRRCCYNTGRDILPNSPLHFAHCQQVVPARCLAWHLTDKYSHVVQKGEWPDWLESFAAWSSAPSVGSAQLLQLSIETHKIEVAILPFKNSLGTDS